MEEMSQNWGFPVLMRDGEAPLPFQDMSDVDVRLWEESNFRVCKRTEEMSQNWGLPLLMRDGEAPLPFHDMSNDDIRLWEEFMATHREQITLSTADCDEVWLWNYHDLTSLIELVRELPILDIIDIRRTEVLEKIKQFRFYKFSGSWFDSLESLMSDNEQNDYEHLENVRNQELELENEHNLIYERLDTFRFMLKKPDLTRDRAKMLSYRVKWFDKQRKLVESQLAVVVEKRNAISEARKSLDFFYP